MAVRTREELMEAIRGRVGDSDEDLAFIEDVTDTLSDLESRAADQTDWQARYEENDREWRERYRSRFFNNEETLEPDPADPDPEEHKTPTSYDELFDYE